MKIFNIQKSNSQLQTTQNNVKEIINPDCLRRVWEETLALFLLKSNLCIFSVPKEFGATICISIKLKLSFRLNDKRDISLMLNYDQFVAFKAQFTGLH